MPEQPEGSLSTGGDSADGAGRRPVHQAGIFDWLNALSAAGLAVTAVGCGNGAYNAGVALAAVGTAQPLLLTAALNVILVLRFALAKSAGRSVCPAAGSRCAREGVVRSLGVPGGDRAPLTREFPTNSGVGVSAPKGIKKTVPKDGEGDDGMRLLSDVSLVAAGGLIWNPHDEQPLIQCGKQVQLAEVIPRF